MGLQMASSGVTGPIGRPKIVPKVVSARNQVWQLLQNCLMLINTLLVERTIEGEGLWERLTAEDLRALTPLFHGHINPNGQFALDLARPSFLEAA